jgi:hypothetical protein
MFEGANLGLLRDVCVASMSISDIKLPRALRLRRACTREYILWWCLCEGLCVHSGWAWLVVRRFHGGAYLPRVRGA